MSTLLVLGSKPEPALPSRSEYQDVACANGSGYSAACHGLAEPRFTVLTASLASGSATGRQSLRALAGLHTGTVYFVPPRPLNLVARVHPRRIAKRRAMKPEVLRRLLAETGFGYDQFVVRDYAWYVGRARELCDDESTQTRLARKRPSTGLLALVVGMAEGGYDRFVLSGFSFELTHSYGRNPKIEGRGTATSGHEETDVTFLRSLAKRHDLVTTERVVSERTGIPLLPPG
ncbi:MAG: hypothetical protein QNK04_29825 [Myxococcota bacterium]|nr:hypothetical protein [Myxococcota bacterium]